MLPLLIGLIVVTMIGLVVADQFDLMTDGSAQIIAAVVAMSALALSIGSGALGRYRAPGGGGKALSHIAIWLAIGCAFALLFMWGGPLTENFR
jgi:hypothetical protein